MLGLKLNHVSKRGPWKFYAISIFTMMLVWKLFYCFAVELYKKIALFKLATDIYSF